MPVCMTPQDPPPINFNEWKEETDPKLVDMFQKAFQGTAVLSAHQLPPSRRLGPAACPRHAPSLLCC